MPYKIEQEDESNNVSNKAYYRLLDALLLLSPRIDYPMRLNLYDSDKIKGNIDTGNDKIILSASWVYHEPSAETLVEEIVKLNNELKSSC